MHGPGEELSKISNVLIVEDEILVALDIEEILSRAGFRVIGIAPDSLSLPAGGDDPDAVPHLAFVDLNLRDGMTGPQIACRLAELHNTQIVYVTANPSQISPRAGTAIGYIRKPYTDEAILAAALTAAGQSDRTMPTGEFVRF